MACVPKKRTQSVHLRSVQKICQSCNSNSCKPLRYCFSIRNFLFKSLLSTLVFAKGCDSSAVKENPGPSIQKYALRSGSLHRQICIKKPQCLNDYTSRCLRKHGCQIKKDTPITIHNVSHLTLWFDNERKGPLPDCFTCTLSEDVK